ncbi:glucose-6-phosphate isomerase, partial [Candidatus Pelagibacter sp.]|nr:glucose-6-phosphate isomerase [Candidatus Pelagibacter sp.]
LTKDYQMGYDRSLIKSLKNYKKINLIGMGGSILGTQAIYDFFKHRIKKNFYFFDNLQAEKFVSSNEKKINILVSKSGNTLETISNFNILRQKEKKNKNIFITEKKISFLTNLAKKLKVEVVEHKNFIGGRYSVLSEVGMLPAELMGLNEKKFKNFNQLIKNKNFVNSLIENVLAINYFVFNKKTNSIILNYDEKSDSFFRWYQQLTAESLGKKGKGILPLISTMPKDNHSLLQLYLDGPKNNFFTFFNVSEKNSPKFNNSNLNSNFSHLKNKNLYKILVSQKKATENVFNKKNIPFRSFSVHNRNEETMGELFSFFILETILLGQLMKVNPFDQPSVELIKKETVKILR